MTREEFETIVAEEFPRAVPERFQHRIKNVAILVEDEPSQAVREQEKLHPGDTLLGLYQGISLDRRGAHYGMGPTLPDTITLYQKSLETEAGNRGGTIEHLRQVVRDTIWHEVAHYFGFDEHAVGEREDRGENYST